MNPSPTSVSQLDPIGLFTGAALGSLLLYLLASLVLAALGVLATYWLIRLAVRHGTMDTVRWQAATMSPRSAEVAPAVASAPAPARPHVAPRPRRDSGVPVPPRSTMEW